MCLLQLSTEGGVWCVCAGWGVCISILYVNQCILPGEGCKQSSYYYGAAQRRVWVIPWSDPGLWTLRAVLGTGVVGGKNVKTQTNPVVAMGLCMGLCYKYLKLNYL